MKNDSSVIFSTKNDFNYEIIRLQTFINWPHKFAQPQQLAMTGFYFIGPQHDNVKCYFCKVEISGWVEDDDIVNEHIRWSQSCALLRRKDTNNVPLNVYELNRLIPQSIYDDNGPCSVQIHHIPYHESLYHTLPKSAMTISNSIQPILPTVNDIKSKITNDQDSKLCRICYDEEFNTVFVPCGHSFACMKCTSTVGNCPLCRKSVETILRVYFP